MYVQEEQLRDFLLDTGLVSRAQLDAAVALAQDNDAPLSRVLVETGVLGEDVVRRAVAQALGIPFIHFTPNEIAPEALIKIPEPVARAHGMVAVAVEGSVLHVAVLDIASLPVLEQLQLHATYKIAPRLTDRESMTKALLQYQKNLKEQFGSRIAAQAQAVDTPASASLKDLRTAAERVAVGHVVDALIAHALYQLAGVVYLEVKDAGMLVRYRIGTHVYDAMLLPGRAAASIVLRLKLLAKLSLDSTLPQEGRFRVALGDTNEQVLVRVATVPAMRNGAPYEKVVVQLLHERMGRRGFTLESLGLHGDSLEKVHAVLQQKTGLLLVCGQEGVAEGAGKTTFLYTLLDMFGGLGYSVASVEDNIEMYMPFVTQTQVDEGVGLSVAAALRAVLRQNPDVIMVSDIRDRETALLVIEAANRGVLVIAAIEAGSASAGIFKMLELGVSSVMLATTLKISLATRLVRRVCPNKQESKRLSRDYADALEPYADFGRVLSALKAEGIFDASALWRDVLFFKAHSCIECRGGYSGTVGLQEVLSTSATIKELLLREIEQEVLEGQAREEGMLTLVEDGLYKAAQGQTSIEEIVGLAAEQ